MSGVSKTGASVILNTPHTRRLKALHGRYQRARYRALAQNPNMTIDLRQELSDIGHAFLDLWKEMRSVKEQ
jgi:hypothetical protein